MIIEQDAFNILEKCTIKENMIFLPDIKLDRNTYLKVNKCLENIGGKWNKKYKAHVFDYDPTEMFENLLLTKNTEDLKKTFQFFPTPIIIAEKMCELAEIKNDDKILEPSCGNGNISDVIYNINKNIVCIEINQNMKNVLSYKDYYANIIFQDFLDFDGENFDKIIMNPPFSKQQDIDHIYHAYELLKDNGILISVISLSPFFRTNKKSLDFRNWLNELNAEIIDVPSGSFKESGTMIETKIIKIKK